MKKVIGVAAVVALVAMVVVACATGPREMTPEEPVGKASAEQADSQGKDPTDRGEPHLGGKGPGGGIIFYDDRVGFDFDGDGNITADEKELFQYTYLADYRFLEAAPRAWNLPDTRDDPSVYWGGDSYNIPEIVDAEINLVDPAPKDIIATLGNGKHNTELIISSLAEHTQETGTAAHLCVEYRGGGLDDWFLPSVGELVVLQGMMDEVGGILLDGYNSSSESMFNNLRWVVNMRKDSAGVDTIRKYHTRKVRPIRAF
jgi:hypothetical protein